MSAGQDWPVDIELVTLVGGPSHGKTVAVEGDCDDGWPALPASITVGNATYEARIDPAGNLTYQHADTARS